MYESIKEMLDNATTEDGMESLLSFPIRVDVRAEWHTLYDITPDPCEYRITLPMQYRVIGDLGDDGQPITASLQKYDSWDGWHNLTIGVDPDIVLRYARTIMHYS